MNISKREISSHLAQFAFCKWSKGNKKCANLFALIIGLNRLHKFDFSKGLRILNKIGRVRLTSSLSDKLHTLYLEVFFLHMLYNLNLDV